jgi:hypothetical protein
MDPTIESATDSRPKVITTAIRILTLSIAIGLLMSLVRVAQQVSGAPLILAILIVLAFFGVFLFLVSRIWAGRNWARIVFLILVLIGLPFAIPNYIAELRKNVLSGSVSMLIVILQLLGTYLLFTKNSNTWFRARKQK